MAVLLRAAAPLMLLLLLTDAVVGQGSEGGRGGRPPDDGTSTAAGIALPSGLAAPMDVCREQVYLSQCQQHPSCYWCCDAPFGSQCMSLSNSSMHALVSASSSASDDVPWMCPATARIAYGSSSTCESRCGEVAECGNCEALPWCYFCVPSGSCQAPHVRCTNSEVVQRCAQIGYQPKEPFADGLRIFVYVCFGLLVLSVVVTGAAFAANLRRQMAESMALGAESEPLLTTAAADTRPSSSTSITDRPSAALERGADGTFSGAPPVGPPEAQREELPEAGAPEGTPRTTSHQLSIGDDSSLCYLCLETPSSVTFLPCYHSCCCELCSNRIRPTGGVALTCPFCRTRIEAMVSLRSVAKPVVTEHRAP